MRRISSMTGPLCVMWSLILAGMSRPQQVAADETPSLKLTSPLPYQVTQRIGIDPGTGYALVSIRAECSVSAPETIWEYRTSPQAGNSAVADWMSLTAKIENSQITASARIPAGGWYRLELRSRVGDNVTSTGFVEPIGVGEVFVVAGQSYATNCNDELLKITDPQQRVVAFDAARGTWGVAHDPQPVPDGSDGGSIWPPLGDALAEELGVPVAFANVAWGGTSSMQWMPEGTLHPRLAKAGQVLGRFRAVLWQQGESDVIANTSSETYIANLRSIRDAAVTSWEFEPTWLLAKSTHHPTVYNDPEKEGRIRGAIETLTQMNGFAPGPDTDELKQENRGGAQSRRHFSAIGQRNAATMWHAAIRRELLPEPMNTPLRVGVAEADITPPIGFPMAGYYHERLAEGEIDPLKAKAIVFRHDNTSAAFVVCDLIGIATDLKIAVQKEAAEKTGIPAAHISIAATHTHTAPDYMKELYLRLGNEPQEELRAAYIDKLIAGCVDAIAQANEDAQPALLESGSATQQTPVSFNRRAVTKDGTVKTWMGVTHPDFVKTAGPIDPEIGLLTIRQLDGATRGVFSNFALHLDTVGGTKWSADYPFFIERTLRHAQGASVVSLFGNGCCGDINHANPRGGPRNTADMIGSSIGQSILRDFDQLQQVVDQNLVVKTRTIPLPLQDATESEVAHSIDVLNAAKRGDRVDFLEHVTAYKKLIIDQLRHKEPYAKTAEHITWGLSRSLAGIGDTIPVQITVITLGHDIALIALPGEDFVQLGLAIKASSPFRTTMVVELSNCVETIYVPTRAAYAVGSYEVTNSTTLPGSGEMIVEAALGLLREAAAEQAASR